LKEEREENGERERGEGCSLRSGREEAHLNRPGGELIGLGGRESRSVEIHSTFCIQTFAMAVHCSLQDMVPEINFIANLACGLHSVFTGVGRAALKC
jgi:hypothetical protein